MNKMFARIALCAGLAAMASLAQASPVHWVLNGVQFTDGSTATGSFDFDAATTTYSNVSITTSTNSTTYLTTDLATVFGLDATGINLIDNFVSGGNNSGSAILNLDFVSALTDAGGVVGITIGFPSFEGSCLAANCGSGTILRESVRGGSVVGTAIPEPGVLSLVGLSLAGLALTRRSRA